MKATTLLLATLLTATAAQQEAPATQTEQAQSGQPAAAEPPPSPTTIINQGISKEEIKEALLELQEEQTPPPSWLTPLSWFAGITVAIFTALTAAFGIFLGLFTMRRKEEIDKTAREVQDDKDKSSDILREAVRIKDELDAVHKDAREKHEELSAMTAETAYENPGMAAKIAAQSTEGYESPIDKAIAEAIAYQTNEQYELATEKWLAIANITKEQDKETAARAYFSAAYLIQVYDDKYKDEATVNEVISLYSNTLSINPDNTAALNNRGLAKAHLGQLQEAIEDYDKALSIRPDYAGILYNRGLARADLKQFQKATEDISKALNISPDLGKAISDTVRRTNDD